MSLPLTRRIARAALLVAAGAAAGVGAAGSASAAPELPATPNLGGLTALDGANVGNTVDAAAQNVTETAGDTGGKAVKKTVPAAGKTGGSLVKKTTPVAQKTAGDAAGSAGDVVGDTAKTATESGLPTDALGKGGLPVQGLPVGQSTRLVRLRGLGVPRPRSRVRPRRRGGRSSAAPGVRTSGRQDVSLESAARTRSSVAVKATRTKSAPAGP